MILFKPKVKPEILGRELVFLCENVRAYSRTQIHESVGGLDGVCEEALRGMRLRIGDLTIFAIDYALRKNMKPEQAEALRENVLMFASGDPTPYWRGLTRIPEGRRFGRTRIEYLMVGETFLDQCGKTGVAEADDAIRRLGAETFLKASVAAEKHIKRVRLESSASD